MNFRYVLNQFGLLMLVLAAMLAAVAAWAGFRAWMGDPGEAAATEALVVAAGVAAILGGGLWRITRCKGQVGRREALLLVAMSWLLGAAFAALPFWAWAYLHEPARQSGHEFSNFADCYFEAMSGLTTTGASILRDIPTVPHSILMWRSLTHWLGGLGIVVLFVAVLPSLGAGGKKLYKVESSGPKVEGVTPHIHETARALYTIYVAFTIMQILLLRIAGVSWFESACHTFGTLSGGGFGTQNASIGYYDSVWVEIIVIVFMAIGGVNFGLYYFALRGKLNTLYRDTELRIYLACLLLATVIIALALMGTTIYSTNAHVQPIHDAGLGQAVRYAAFQVVSIQTTTGFCTADFDRWPFIAQTILVLLMFIGGSAGSCAGGIKVIRIWIMLKVLRAEIELAFRPQVVRPMKVGGVPVDPQMRLGAVTFAMTMILIVGIGTLSLVLIERGAGNDVSFTTAATATIATLFNTGPGLERVSALGNYAFFTSASKIVMSGLMALGRLELFAILVLFSRHFWRTQ